MLLTIKIKMGEFMSGTRIRVEDIQGALIVSETTLKSFFDQTIDPLKTIADMIVPYAPSSMPGLYDAGQVQQDDFQKSISFSTSESLKLAAMAFGLRLKEKLENDTRIQNLRDLEKPENSLRIRIRIAWKINRLNRENKKLEKQIQAAADQFMVLRQVIVKSHLSDSAISPKARVSLLVAYADHEKSELLAQHPSLNLPGKTFGSVGARDNLSQYVSYLKGDKSNPRPSQANKSDKRLLACCKALESAFVKEKKINDALLKQQKNAFKQKPLLQTGKNYFDTAPAAAIAKLDAIIDTLEQRKDFLIGKDLDKNDDLQTVLRHTRDALAAYLNKMPLELDPSASIIRFLNGHMKALADNKGIVTATPKEAGDDYAIGSNTPRIRTIPKSDRQVVNTLLNSLISGLKKPPTLEQGNSNQSTFSSQASSPASSPRSQSSDPRGASSPDSTSSRSADWDPASASSSPAASPRQPAQSDYLLTFQSVHLDGLFQTIAGQEALVHTLKDYFNRRMDYYSAQLKNEASFDKANQFDQLDNTRALLAQFKPFMDELYRALYYANGDANTLLMNLDSIIQAHVDAVTAGTDLTKLTNPQKEIIRFANELKALYVPGAVFVALPPSPTVTPRPVVPPVGTAPTQGRASSTGIFGASSRSSASSRTSVASRKSTESPAVEESTSPRLKSGGSDKT